MHQGHFASVSTPEVNQVQRAQFGGKYKTCICQWPLVSLLLMMWSPSLQVLAKACSCLWLASYYFFSDVEHLHAVIKDTMKDESFLVAPHLIQSARELEFWLIRNTDKAAAFMVLWRGIMEPCSGLPSKKKEREKMWSTYHTIRTSRDFVQLWEELLAISTSAPPEPLLYQHFSHLLFQRQLEEKLPSSSTIPTEEKPLTEVELKALRYTAGFVPHSLLRKMSKSTHPKKKELCLYV